MTAVLSSFRSHFLKRPWILLCSVVFFCGLLIPRLSFLARKNLLNPTTVESNEFRSQPVSEELFPILASSDDPGRFLGLYWLETRFQADPHALRTCLTALNHSDEPTDFSVKKYEPHWENLPDWNEYLKLAVPYGMISGIFRLLHPPIVLTTPSPLKIPGNTKEPMEGNAVMKVSTS